MIIIQKPDSYDSDNNKNKWCIIEFQGCFEDSSPSKLSSEILGDLVHKEKDTYQLQIGNQLFEGKDIKLKNPLLVIRKVKSSNSDNSSNITEYEVNTLIHSKICFTNRPSTLITQQAVKYGSPQHRKSPASSPVSTPEKTDNDLSTSPMKTSPIQQPKFN